MDARGSIVDFMPISRSKLISDYYLEIAAPKKSNDNWGWEIRRKSMPLGVRIYGDKFKSESTARAEGEKMLQDFLNRLFHDLD
jgi:hypothetical protein